MRTRWNPGDPQRSSSRLVLPGRSTKFHRPWSGPYTVMEAHPSNDDTLSSLNYAHEKFASLVWHRARSYSILVKPNPLCAFLKHACQLLFSSVPSSNTFCPINIIPTKPIGGLLSFLLFCGDFLFLKTLQDSAFVNGKNWWSTRGPPSQEQIWSLASPLPLRP